MEGLKIHWKKAFEQSLKDIQEFALGMLVLLCLSNLSIRRDLVLKTSPLLLFYRRGHCD